MCSAAVFAAASADEESPAAISEGVAALAKRPDTAKQRDKCVCIFDFDETLRVVAFDGKNKVSISTSCQLSAADLPLLQLGVV